MKHYFGKKRCSHCNAEIDAIETHCSHCGTDLLETNEGENNRDLKEFYRFEKILQVSYFKQIAFFLVGWAGLQIVGFIVSFCYQAYGTYGLGLNTVEQLKEYLTSADVRFAINIIMYLSIFVIMALLLWKKGWKEIGRSFKKPSAILIGLAGFIALLATNFIYNFFVSVIFNAAGFTPPGVNDNETTLRQLCDVNFPVSIIVLGLIGPFVEEITYRCGLFSFLSRTKRWIAYVVSGIVFGMIHFTWDFSSTEAIITELVNLPTYVGAGLMMAFVYEKGGFAASYTMHAFNNTFSILLNSLAGK